MINTFSFHIHKAWHSGIRTTSYFRFHDFSVTHAYQEILEVHDKKHHHRRRRRNHLAKLSFIIHAQYISEIMFGTVVCDYIVHQLQQDK
jgi:hypothetical protein